MYLCILIASSDDFAGVGDGALYIKPLRCVFTWCLFGHCFSLWSCLAIEKHCAFLQSEISLNAIKGGTFSG